MGNTISAGVTATVVTPLNIVSNQQLNLGKFSSAAAGTVNQGGGTTGGVTSQTVGNAATFTVTGDANAQVNVTLNANGTIDDGNGNTLNVVYNAPASITLDATGQGTLSVGATATVPANTPLGVYTGSVTGVTVTYPL